MPKEPERTPGQMGKQDYVSASNAAISLKEEGVKIIYRQGEPVACYKQNGTLKMYKLVEVTYADIAEIYEPTSHL